MIIINGRFLTQKITGVQRFGIEVTKALDKLVSQNKIEIVAPPGIINNIQLKNIKIKVIGKRGGNFWTQITLPFYAKKNKGHILTMSGMIPLLKPDFFVAHDTTFIRFPTTFSKLFYFGYLLNFKLALKKCKGIFTVSEFSKRELIKEFKINENKITVVSPSSNHLINTDYKEVSIKKWNLEPQEYFLSVSSQAKHKNQEFIYCLAKREIEKKFVIVGGKPHTISNVNSQRADNIVYTGYVTDDELYSLYKNARGFIFPSLYEGFGLPPLEAIIMGVKCIAVSNISVFKEIYHRNVYYFDPLKPDLFDFEKMSEKKLSDDDVNYYKELYSWHKTASIILNQMHEEIT